VSGCSEKGEMGKNAPRKEERTPTKGFLWCPSEWGETLRTMPLIGGLHGQEGGQLRKRKEKTSILFIFALAKNPEKSAPAFLHHYLEKRSIM